MRAATADATEAEARASVFSFLARTLGAPPDTDVVRGVRELARELGLARPAEVSLVAVARDYMDLLVVPGPRYVAPYESVFRDEWPVPPGLAPAAAPHEGAARMRGLVMGDSTERVRACFVEAGVRPEADLPDHVANELRLMAHLWSRTAQDAAGQAPAAADLRERLRREHLQQWIGDLARRVIEREQTGFYGLAVTVAAAVLQDDGHVPPIIAIVGRTNSGKTTLIERLIPALAERGYRVGTIKHHHHGDFEADQKGKDSWRHAQAGAVATAVVGSQRLAVFQRVEREPAPDAVARLFAPPPDLILAEGYSDSAYPKVEVVRVARSATPLCATATHLIALVTDGDCDLGVPRFGLEEIDAIAEHVVREVRAAPGSRPRPAGSFPAAGHRSAADERRAQPS